MTHKHSEVNPDNELSKKEKAVLLVVAGLGAIGIGRGIDQKINPKVECEPVSVTVEEGVTGWGLSGSNAEQYDKTKELNPNRDLGKLHKGDTIEVCIESPKAPKAPKGQVQG